MTRASILVCGLILTGCGSLSVHETPARAALGQSADQEKRDRAECHQKADEWAQAHHLRADTAACMLARGYAIHLRYATLAGFLSVVVTPAKATPDSDDWTLTTAARDLGACRTDLFQYVAAHPLGATGMVAMNIPADDDVRDRFLACWRQRGYEAREHKSSEGGLEEAQ